MPNDVREGESPPGLAPAFIGPCRWLLALDYDGTLRSADLDSPAPIDPGFFGLMLRLRNLGVRWGVNTGRDLPYFWEDFSQDSPFLPDFICTCERYVYMADDEGRLQPAAEHNEQAQLATLELRNALTAPYGEFMNALRHRYPTLLWRFSHADPLSIEAEDVDTMNILADLIGPFLNAWDNVAMQRAGRYMRLSDARFNKGTALQYVAARWNVAQDHVAMVGDGHNDLDMFRAFPGGFCAAPGEAHPEVLDFLQAHGGFIAPRGGLMEALQHWRKHVLSR